MNAHLSADANSRRRLALREDLCIGADANFEVLRPHALRNQHFLDAARSRGSRTNVVQVVADDGGDRVAKAFGSRRIAARLFFDHAFEKTGNECHAAGLDCLQVARRQQPRAARVTIVW
jgi:hypothetical protein